MKNRSFLLLFFIILASCNKGSDCNDENLSIAIIGKWNVTQGMFSFGYIEFLPDGTFIDDGFIFGYGVLDGEILNERTYSITGTDMLKITFSKTGIDSMLHTDFHVTSFSCNEISLNDNTGPYVFKK